MYKENNKEYRIVNVSEMVCKRWFEQHGAKSTAPSSSRSEQSVMKRPAAAQSSAPLQQVSDADEIEHACGAFGYLFDQIDQCGLARLGCLQEAARARCKPKQASKQALATSQRGSSLGWSRRMYDGKKSP